MYVLCCMYLIHTIKSKAPKYNVHTIYKYNHDLRVVSLRDIHSSCIITCCIACITYFLCSRWVVDLMVSFGSCLYVLFVAQLISLQIEFMFILWHIICRILDCKETTQKVLWACILMMTFTTSWFICCIWVWMLN